MEKDKAFINSDSFRRLGIDPKEAIEYLENKKAKDVNPCHVKCLLNLKEQPAVASS